MTTLTMATVLKYNQISLIFIRGWQCCEKMVRTRKKKKIPKGVRKRKVNFLRLSTRRFIPEGNEVSRVLIHLPSFIFRRHGSQLGDNLITMTDMSDSKCAPLLKRLATGDTSVLRCAMSNR